MKNIIIILTALILTSCVWVGSGIRTVTGTVSGTGLTNVKVGLFAPDNLYVFSHDDFNDANKDVVFKNGNGAESSSEVGVGLLSPVQYVSVGTGGAYSMLFPDDPSTVKCLIAWDDTIADNQFDLGTEPAYLPVKDMGGSDFVIHYFSHIEVAEAITYLAVYSAMDRTAVDYDLDFFDPHQDNFDAIGADGFDFTFD